MSGIHLALLGMTYGPGAPVTVIQSFTATGEWVCPTGVTEVEWLIVAGGGGGGNNNGGGGGAGGYRTGTGLSVTAGTTYTVTVGAGGPWRRRRLWHCHPKIPCTSRNHSHAYLQRIGVLGCT
jgi:hypothetical protein